MKRLLAALEKVASSGLDIYYCFMTDGQKRYLVGHHAGEEREEGPENIWAVLMVFLAEWCEAREYGASLYFKIYIYCIIYP